MIIQSFARLAGILMGSQFQVNVKPATNNPFTPLGIGHFESVKVMSIPNNNNNHPSISRADFALLPIESSLLTSSNDGVSLGWKIPALFLAPFWFMLLLPTRRIRLLLLLIITWLKVPNYGGFGTFEWEVIVDSDSLNRGLIWRYLLGRILDGITRSSLPGILASSNPDGTINSNTRLPRSICRGVKITKGGRNKSNGNGKLVLKGQLQSFRVQMSDENYGINDKNNIQLQNRKPSNKNAVVPTISPPVTVPSLNYTLRMGILPGRVQNDGKLQTISILNQHCRLCSCLLYDSPELKLLGNEDEKDGWISKFFPQIWVPTLSHNCGVCLPRRLELQNAMISDAGDGVRLKGRLFLGRKDIDW